MRISRTIKSTVSPGLPLEAWLGGCLLAACLAVGCASKHPDEPRANKQDPFQTPAPPVLLNSPLAALLTNAGSFSARVSLQDAISPEPTELESGDLLVRGSRLLYAPTGGPAQAKRYRMAGIRFIWDIEQNRGWVVSEALQGCAPIGPNANITNVTIVGRGPAREKVDGHPCEQQEATATMRDGTAAVYRVWRAADFKGIPLQISSVGSASPLTLKITKIRLEPPPEELFRPPDGFTRFSNAEAFVTEWVMREQNLKKKSPPDRGEPPLEGQPPPR